MGKLKFMILNEKQVATVKDALRAYLALRTEEYHEKPDLKKAQIMDDINECLDLFVVGKTPDSKIKKRVDKFVKSIKVVKD
jgi:hypothetical protein